MSVAAKPSTFLATEEKGEVSALHLQPRGSEALLVLGHGAGSNLRHPFMEELAQALADRKVATFRYNYPYSERGGGMDGERVRLATVRAAVMTASKLAGRLPLFAGGHSMSGRMTSMAEAAESIPGLKGIVFYAFPLHPSGKPGADRADHLQDVGIPMLFLSGPRDKLAECELLEPIVKKLGRKAALHLIDTADHGFKILKRTRKSDEPPIQEAARVTAEWIQNLGP